MAFDGSVVAGLTYELNSLLSGGYISKIAQPEKDALMLTIKNNGTQHKLLLSASAGLPLIYLTDETKPSPLTAPNFCMLLRKHIGGGRITEICQPSLERIIRIRAEHLDEMGDLSAKYLIIELMGKYSNIILTDENNKILDSIKHINAFTSSVREVLPGRNYFVPAQAGRLDPFLADEAYFHDVIAKRACSVLKALSQSLTGFSYLTANELCFLSEIDADLPVSALDANKIRELFLSFRKMTENIRNGNFSPSLYLDENGEIVDFSAFPLAIYGDFQLIKKKSFSSMLKEFYGAKDASDRIRQKSADLRKVISNAIARTANKIDIFRKQLKDTEKRDKFRLYGELITTYGYQAEEGDRTLSAINYHSGTEILIPLDPEIPVMANAKKYFDKYARLKRTFEAVTVQLSEAETELLHLESVKTSLNIAKSAEDLSEIREELSEHGYVKKTRLSKKGKTPVSKGKPLHYLSSDGFDLYVGKNNFQNDYLTFKLADGNDWWFHAKKRAGSHVILVTNGREVPDRTFEEAAKLAVFYSSANSSGTSGNLEKYEVDYVQKKEVKKPNGAKPGFVVYYTNYSLVADSDISMLTLI